MERSGRGLILRYYPIICLEGGSKTKKNCTQIGVRAGIRSGHLLHTNQGQLARFESVPEHKAMKAYGGVEVPLFKHSAPHKLWWRVVVSRFSRPTTGEGFSGTN